LLAHDVLQAYTKFRPDVGFVRPMLHVLSVLLSNMDGHTGDLTFAVFKSFANLIHSTHLIEFYMAGDAVDFRLRAFNETFERLLPHVAHHF
jgi:hypothetical protein